MAKDSALFLWLPAPHLLQLARIMEAWGFGYPTDAWTWIKHNPITDKSAFGLGLGATRKNCEHCYLGRRGSPARLSRSVRDFILAPKREHSRKPDQQYSLIESLFPGPYVELFARYPRLGWHAWGDQLESLSPRGADRR
jgi:N6-adenosine-specific RNA methylase IME4